MNFANIIDKLKGFWNQFDPAKRKRVLVVAVMLIIGIAVFAALINRTQYTVLYTGLSTSEAGEIYQKLVDTGVAVRMQNDGTLLVEKEKEEESRMTLAAEGYPKSGFSYDLYMDNITMGTSESEKDKLMVFQLQDRLQKTIETLGGVRSAIVTLSIPDNDIFVLLGERDDVTASVVIDLVPGAPLANSQVEAIRNLVASSVSGLAPEKVSIVDTDMNLLGDEQKSGLSDTSERYELQKSLESDLEDCILSMLEPIYGAGQVKTAVSVHLNFNAESTESVLYEPVVDDQGIPVSVEESQEKSQSAGETGDSAITKTQSSTSYQVNQIIKKLEQAQGVVDNISASVIVNQEELDTDTMEKIRSIAAYAVGTDGQYINVVALPFVEKGDESVPVQSESTLPGWLNEKLILEIAAIVFIFVLLLVGLRTFRKEKPKKTVPVIDQLRPESEGPKVGEIPVDRNPEAGFKQEIEKFVDKRPDEVARLLRKWVAEDK